jgi:hypothetical protein
MNARLETLADESAEIFSSREKKPTEIHQLHKNRERDAFLK